MSFTKAFLTLAVAASALASALPAKRELASGGHFIDGPAGATICDYVLRPDGPVPADNSEQTRYGHFNFILWPRELSTLPGATGGYFVHGNVYAEQADGTWHVTHKGLVDGASQNDTEAFLEDYFKAGELIPSYEVVWTVESVDCHAA